MQFKQAGLLEDEDVSILWKELLKIGKPKPKEAALALAICYLTGARMGEALSIRFEDSKFVKDSGNEFLEAHLRSTKTNPFAQRKETLTLPLSIQHIVPISNEIKKLCHNKRSGKKGKKQLKISLIKNNLKGSCFPHSTAAPEQLQTTSRDTQRTQD